MKRPITAMLLAFAAGGSAIAADLAKVPVAQRPGFETISERDLRADLHFVASAALQGRMSLQPGDAASIEWVAAEFAKAGLQPAATDDAGKPSYLQPVPLIEYRADSSRNALTLKTGQAEQTWRTPNIIGGFRDDIDLEAPVAFAGFGITAPGVGYDDYQGLDVKGKIVLVFEHEPQENVPQSRFGGTGNTRHATNRVKALNAQAHGAVAMIVMAEPNRKHPSNIDRVNRIGGSARRVPPLPSQALANDVLRIPIITIADPVATALLASTGMTPAMLQDAIDRDLTPQSRDVPGARLALRLQNNVRSRGNSHNVVGLLPGSDPRLAPETIILSAHHDHDGFNGPEIFHGADDNGSGTVGIVALARAFAANPVKPRRSILFVVFAAEERGLLGAYHLANTPLRPLATTRAMINFDMIGRDEAASEQTDGLIKIPADTSNRLNLIGAGYSPDFDATVRAANASVGLVLDDRFDRDNALNIFFRSDQFPFVLKDIPAFWFFTGFHPDYHHSSDTADKINYPKMTRIVQLAYLSAWRFANDGAVPAFVRDPPGAR
jgi:Peptidase family M28/PA domain